MRHVSAKFVLWLLTEEQN